MLWEHRATERPEPRVVPHTPCEHGKPLAEPSQAVEARSLRPKATPLATDRASSDSGLLGHGTYAAKNDAAQSA